MTPPDFHLTERPGPLILSAPHPGRGLPDAIAGRMTPAGRRQLDADHHVHALYDFAEAIGASTLTAQWSRYVVDLNRSPDDQPLYPGQFGSGLVPTETFDGEALYLDGETPGRDEMTERVARYWRPYHEALARLIDATRRRHGYCLVWDCHSIAPVAPRLFEGRLSDLNLGSFDGRACPAALANAVLEAIPAEAPYSRVLDGRFKGGFITRQYGRPQDGVFALQLELSQAVYLADDASLQVDPARHDRLRPSLRAMIDTFLHEAPRHV